MSRNPKKGDKVRVRVEGVNYDCTISRIIINSLTGIPEYELRGMNIVTVATQDQFI